MEDCIFCKIIKGEIPGKFVFKDRDFVAFYDIVPKAPVHVLVVPKLHFESLRDVDLSHEKLLGKLFVKTRTLAEDLGIAKEGYKIVVNNGKGAGQLVFHLHIHLLGGWKRSPGWEV